MSKKAAIIINRKRLAHEILFLFTVIILLILWRFLPWFFIQPVPIADPYTKYKELYNEVISYDYSKGRNLDLENRISYAIENTSSSVNKYFKYKAKLEYYRGIGDYSTAFNTIEDAIEHSPNYEETRYIYQSALEISEILGKTEQAEEYRSILSNLE